MQPTTPKPIINYQNYFNNFKSSTPYQATTQVPIQSTIQSNTQPTMQSTTPNTIINYQKLINNSKFKSKFN